MRLAKRRRVGPDDPMAVVTRFLDAANQHDADTLYASVHPAFESFQPLHPDRNFRGPGQLISNWKAIFDAEPGFRLTVLRASTTGNTVWVELHGAGDSAEAAGIFIVGVENGRIRWVRVYSDLIENVPQQEHPEGTTPIGTVGGQPTSAVSDAQTPPARGGAPAVPAAVADNAGSETTGGGPLRLVEASDERAPDAAATSETPPDPGLRLVDPTTADRGPGGQSDGSPPDPGPVETLVGPSRIVPAAPAPVDEPAARKAEALSAEALSAEALSAEALSAEALSAEALSPGSARADATDGDNKAAGGDPFFSARTSGTEVGPTDARDHATPSAANEQAGDNEVASGAEAVADRTNSATDAAPADPLIGSDDAFSPNADDPSAGNDKADPAAPVEPRSSDVGSRPAEAVLARLRKALRKA